MSKLLSGILTLVNNKLMRMDNFKLKGTSGYWTEIEQISDLVNICYIDSRVELINVDSKFKASWSSKNKWSFKGHVRPTDI